MPKIQKVNWISLLALSSLFTIQIYSQNDFRSGYIINLNNDTIYGLIDYNANTNNECRFKKSENATVELYYPLDILSYRFTNDKFFISKEITIKKSYLKNIFRQVDVYNPEGKFISSQYEIEGNLTFPVFIECLVQGELNLYYYRDKQGIDHYFIENTNKQLTDLAEEQVNLYSGGALVNSEVNHIYKGKLKSIMQDCPQLYGRVETTKLNHKDMINLTQLYNIHMSPDKKSITYTKSIKPVKLSYGVHAGISNKKSENIYFYVGNTMNSYSIDALTGPLLGFELRIRNLFPTFEKMTVVINADYSMFSHKQEFKLYTNYFEPSENKVVSNVILASISSLNRLNMQDNSPFIELGILSCMRINSLTGDDEEVKLADDNALNFGVLVSLGYEVKPIKKGNSKIYIKAAYQKLVQEQNINLTIGYIFK